MINKSILFQLSIIDPSGIWFHFVDESLSSSPTLCRAFLNQKGELAFMVVPFSGS